MSLLARITVVSAALVAVGVSWAGLAVTRWAAGSAACPGVRVGGRTLAARDDVEAILRDAARIVEARRVEVVVPGVPTPVRTATLAELGVRVDYARALAAARRVAREGSWLDRADAALAARRGELAVSAEPTVDASVFDAIVLAIKDDTDEAPEPARLDLAHHAKVPHKPGHFVDLDAAREALVGLARGEGTRLELPRVDVPPRVSSELLADLAIDVVVSAYETHFSRGGDMATRARNVERAAARLDGVVLMPGEVVSFNAIVGPRTVENGFARGWEIFKGEMVEGIGGGTCQAASTFHAAAFLGGLDVVERLPHSRPSAYITMGLDATVVFPSVDLKVRNPWSFPIVVHTEVDAGTLRVELLGREKPATVTFGRDVLATRPFVRKVDEVAGLEPGKIVRKQHGIRGFTIRRTRTVALADGSTRVDENVDVYPPTTEIYLVPPGLDAEAVLPALPEGAKRADSEGAAAGTVQATLRTVAAPCTGEECGAEAPRIVEAPGVHAPSGDQAHASGHVVITR